MLLSGSEKLDDILIRMLAQKGRLSVHEMLDFLERDRHDFTFQAVYKSLAKLRRDAVIFKLGDTYGVSAAWTVQLMDLCEQLKTKFIHELDAKNVIPEEGEKKQWAFKNLLVLDDFWNQLIILMIENSEDPCMVEWIPHPWYHIAQAEKDLQLERAIDLYDKQVYQIIGGDTYLDRLAQKGYAGDTFVYSHAKGPFHNQRNVYFSVIDDLILTLRLGPKMASQIDDYFDSVTSARNFDLSKFLEIIKRRASARFILERNSRKARSLKKKFSQYFGEEF